VTPAVALEPAVLIEPAAVADMPAAVECGRLLIHNHSLVWGGNEKWLATLAVGLQYRGHRVAVSCRRGGVVSDELNRRGISTVHVRPGTYLDVPRGIRFAAWMRRDRPDVVLLTSRKGMLWGAWAAGRARVPRIVVRAGIAEVPSTLRHRLPFRRWVDAVIVNSRFIAQRWREQARWFAPGKVHVVLNGIRPVQPRPDEVERARRGICSDPGATLVAGVGHVAHRKGFDLLLRAAASLGRSDVRVVIVGSGPAEGELRGLADEMGMADRVIWTGHRTDVPNVLAACDVFVLASRNEGMANVMLEAMSAGTPVIATDISGVREALAPTENRPAAGWIVPPDDAGAMSSALAEVLRLRAEAPAQVHARAAEARARIDDWFTVERMVDECERVLFPGVRM
jgi:glycosyltransferase involved in cell wall biosynthesis